MPTRKGHAEWQGDLQKGAGTLGTESRTLEDVSYGFSSRFESGKGTNPEELLGAAHAACYSMALAAAISEAGFKVNSIATEDSVHLEKQENGFAITRMDISVEAFVDGIGQDAFKALAEDTKRNCPVSKALSSVYITLSATLLE